MPEYQYNGKTAGGGEVNGRLVADDPAGLESRLLQKGVFLLHYSPVISPVSQFLTRWLKRSELTRITRQISILLKSRVGLMDALSLVSESIKDKVLLSTFDSVRASLESGKAIGAILGSYSILFDELYVSMIESGELSGDLAGAFGQVADYREKYESSRKKLLSALAYPAMVLVVAALVVMALVLYVVPVFSSLYDSFGAELPALTQRVVSTSNWLRESFAVGLTIIIVLIVLTIAAMLTVRVRLWLGRMLLRAPLLGNLAVKVVSARFCRTLGALLISGVEILYALRIASRTTGNSYLAHKVQDAESLLVEGHSLTETLTSVDIFPRTVLHLSATGEKTGDLGRMLLHAAEYYDQETDTELSTLTTLIEPIVIIVLGVFVAFILVAMYLPLFELVGTM